MSANENRVNRSEVRPADFILDGVRRGAHYTGASGYVVTMDVPAVLPQLLVYRRGGLASRPAPGVSQRFGHLRLDDALTAVSTGLDFPRALIRRPETRDMLLSAAPVLEAIEVAEPVLNVTGIVVKTRVPTTCLDLAGEVLRGLDQLVAGGAIFSDALVATIGADAPDEPAAGSLEALVGRLTEATSWVAGHVARVGNAVEGRLVLTEGGQELTGMLRVAWRDVDALVVDAVLEAAVPEVSWAPLLLTPEQTVFDRLRAIGEERVGDTAIDKAFVIHGDARHAASLRESREVVLRLGAQHARIELSEGRVRVVVPPATREARVLDELCAALLEIWRRLAIARMGHPLVETPEEE